MEINAKQLLDHIEDLLLEKIGDLELEEGGQARKEKRLLEEVQEKVRNAIERA